MTRFDCPEASPLAIAHAAHGSPRLYDLGRGVTVTSRSRHYIAPWRAACGTALIGARRDLDAALELAHGHLAQFCHCTEPFGPECGGTHHYGPEMAPVTS